MRKLLATLVFGLITATGAGADTWPSKPVTLVVPFPPGGSTDPIARALGPSLTVPTMAEAGVRNVDVHSWQAMAGPKGLPADVRSRFHAALVAALGEAQVRQQFASVGLEIVGNTPQPFTAFQQQEFARWKKLIDARKITAD